MSRNYMKSYIDASVEFRNSDRSKESIEKLYELMRELEGTSRSTQESLILSNIYTLLGYHQSAYDVFKTIADESSRKDSAKLYVMKNKADSHGDNFNIRDNDNSDDRPRSQRINIATRKEEREEREPTRLEPKPQPNRAFVSDFRVSKEDDETYVISNRDVIIFGKRPKEEKITINIPTGDAIENYMEKIKEHIEWLGGCRSELIEFYNLQGLGENADDNWYDSIEVIRVMMILDEKGNIFTSVSGGDSLLSDHILDIEVDNRDVISMHYDG